jgi:hypothetical protein
LHAHTPGQYDKAVAKCKDIFEKKTYDYGSAWRILRPSSLTDQIFIKAQRIRSIEVKQENKVGESIESEFIGIVNYCLMAMIQLEINHDRLEMEKEEVMELFEEKVAQCKKLMMDKNHDYGEAWREMRISTFTDLILMKILRIKQIEDKDGNTLISEGLEANFSDMANYAIFALIRLNNFFKE